jgi:hypothetical protein
MERLTRDLLTLARSDRGELHLAVRRWIVRRPPEMTPHERRRARRAAMARPQIAALGAGRDASQ